MNTNKAKKIKTTKPKVQVIKYNFTIPESKLKDNDWIIWWNEPYDAHTRAFINFCINKRHRLYTKVKHNKANVALKRIKD